MIAATVKVYSVPYDKPVKTRLVESSVVVCVVVAGDDLTEYPVMVDPPLSDGAVQVMVAVVDPEDTLALAEVGVPGVVYGVTLLLLDEYVPVPAAFTAATVNVYDAEYVRPVKEYDRLLVSVVVLVVVTFVEVFFAIIEYPVRVEPPSSEGAVHVTVAEVEFAVTEALGEVGAPGVVYGVMLLDEDE